MEQQLSHSPAKGDASRDVVVIHFTGRNVFLDEETACRIRDELLALAEEPGDADLFLDFANVEYLTSTTLGALISLQKKLRVRGRRLTVGNVSPQVQEVFAVTKLDRFFELRLAQQEDRPESAARTDPFTGRLRRFRELLLAGSSETLFTGLGLPSGSSGKRSDRRTRLP
jgi:anti-sigma B factor antagonist